MRRTTTPGARKHAADLRAAAELLVQATAAITDVVEDLHRTIASGPTVLGRPFAAPAQALTALAYGPLRAVTGLVGAGLDGAFAWLTPVLGESVPGPEREALLSALNGVMGDALHASRSPLAIPLSLRSGGRTLALETAALREAFPAASGRLLVLLHGSSMNDRQWTTRGGHDHGALLGRELGLTPVYVHYNSGRHISDNGEELAERLEELVRAWPVEVTELNLLGHSMGGLVARSACHAADRDGLSWRPRLRRLVCLGAPHHGAGLERAANGFESLLHISAYSLPFHTLPRLRSAGVTDLRFGNVVEAHWHGRERFAFERDARSPVPLPEGVDCYAIAGTSALRRKAGGKRLPGDGLVSVASALGQHRRPERTLGYSEAHQLIAFGTTHVGLLGSPEVYAALREWFSPG